MAGQDLRVRAVPSIGDIAATAWDGCAGGAGANPFTRHAFLSALEVSKSATARTGWQPQHLVAETADGSVVGVAPCYLKSHSRGEYVFDRGWAEAYERAGGSYYPKLQVSVPFTPATGRRLMVAPGADVATMRAALAQGLVELCQAARGLLGPRHLHDARRSGARSASAASCCAPTSSSIGTMRALRPSRISSPRCRRASARSIRRERRDALANGIEVVCLTGSDLTEAAWDAFFAFYMETGSRKWGRPYLTREFFSLIGETMADETVLIMAKRAGRYIAGAINFIGDGTLFGRHWGAIEHHPFLHFEICYYQAIEFAIAHKLARVEAGAQGEHKLARGYLPNTTYSAHYIADPAFRRAIDDYLERERAYVEAAGRELLEASPFRKDLRTAECAEEDAGLEA